MREQRGVTLLELLVVITLLGLLSLAVMFSLRISSSAWQRGNARMAADRQVVAAAGLLSSQLANARPRVVRWMPPGTTDHAREVGFAYFDGAPDRLRFLTSYSLEAGARGGLWLAEYFFVSSEGGACDLLYNEWLFQNDPDVAFTVRHAAYDPNLARLRVEFEPATRSEATRRLYRGLRQCHFEYLMEPPEKEAYWGAAWETHAKLLPRAVAARFVGEEKGGIAPVATVATLPIREVLP